MTYVEYRENHAKYIDEFFSEESLKKKLQLIRDVLNTKDLPNNASRLYAIQLLSIPQELMSEERWKAVNAHAATLVPKAETVLESESAGDADPVC